MIEFGLTSLARSTLGTGKGVLIRDKIYFAELQMEKNFVAQIHLPVIIHLEPTNGCTFGTKGKSRICRPNMSIMPQHSEKISELFLLDFSGLRVVNFVQGLPWLSPPFMVKHHFYEWKVRGVQVGGCSDFM